MEVLPRCAGKVPPRPDLGLQLKTSRRIARGVHHTYYECQRLPAAPWTCRESLNPENNVLDCAFVLNDPMSEKGICIAFQNKEYSSFVRALEKFREFRRENLEEAGPNFFDFLKHHTFVHVLVTPNRNSARKQLVSFDIVDPETKVSYEGFEALVTREDIRRFSPTVAFSGCDARVFDETL